MMIDFYISVLVKLYLYLDDYDQCFQEYEETMKHTDSTQVAQCVSAKCRWQINNILIFSYDYRKNYII
jgi:hypothetical protein